MAFPSHEGSNSPVSSKYASPTQKKAQLAAISAIPVTVSFTPKTIIATKQRTAAEEVMRKKTPLASGRSGQQDFTLEKRVEEHTPKFSRAVSNTVTNTHQLLALLRDSTPGSEVAEDLWKELEQIFETANAAKADLPNFTEKQRDGMSHHHSCTMNKSIHKTQDSVQIQHEKIKTHQNFIFEQQDTFQHSKAQTSLQLQEVGSSEEHVSRLTLKKGDFRAEVDKFDELSEKDNARKANDLEITDVLQKELKTLITSKMQLQAENEVIRKTTMGMLEQLKKTEQHVADCFAKELEAKADELQKETVKTALLDLLISALNNGERTSKKLDKVKSDNCLLSLKYNNHALEHAAVFAKPDGQTKKTEILTADVYRLQKQNTDLQAKLEKASKLAEANTELSKANENLTKQLEDLFKQFHQAEDDAKATQDDLQTLKAKLAINDAAAATRNDKALLEKIKGLEEKNDSLEAALAEWTELAKRSYKGYKDMLPIYRQAVKHHQEARDKEAEVDDLKGQLAAAKASQSHGTGASASDTAYWKQKYETLLSTIG